MCDAWGWTGEYNEWDFEEQGENVKILIVNIAWIDNGWTGIDNQTTSGHRHVREGGIAHESLNFKFDGDWNNNDNIYGFCQFTNPPKIVGNDNIIVFYSKKNIVGIYMNVEYGDYKPTNIPSEIGSFNLKASRLNSFKLDEYIPFNSERHLPVDKKKIGMSGLTYTKQEQLVNILNDICTLNANLFSQAQEILETINFKDRDMNIWVIAPGEEASIWDDCRDNGYIAIGWDKINVNDYTVIEDLKKNLISSYEDINEKTRKHNYLWNFGKNIKKGDIVIARNGKTKIIGIGEVVGDYISPEDSNNPRKDNDHKHVRFVNWLDLSEHNISSEGEFAIQTVAKPEADDKRISKYIKNALLIKEIKEKIRLLEHQKQIILQGPPGTGKTRLAKQISEYIINDEIGFQNDDYQERVKLIQFHPSYSYEDFVRGITANTTNEGTVEYKTENKVLAVMAEDANKEFDLAGQDNRDAKPYILIIDEINRANLSSVLGELIYALEYRDEAVESMYALEKDGKGNAIKAEEQRQITLPSNLYIIGTMNTADRSIGHIDYAIRRRFTFIDVLSNEGDVLSQFQLGKKLYKETVKIFNDKDVSPEFIIDDIKIGHSYFIATKDNDETAEDIEKLALKYLYQVLPLLKEYVKDGVFQKAPIIELKDKKIYLEKQVNLTIDEIKEFLK